MFRTLRNAKISDDWEEIQAHSEHLWRSHRYEMGGPMVCPPKTPHAVRRDRFYQFILEDYQSRLYENLVMNIGNQCLGSSPGSLFQREDLNMAFSVISGDVTIPGRQGSATRRIPIAIVLKELFTKVHNARNLEDSLDRHQAWDQFIEDMFSLARTVEVPNGHFAPPSGSLEDLIANAETNEESIRGIFANNYAAAHTAVDSTGMVRSGISFRENTSEGCGAWLGP